MVRSESQRNQRQRADFAVFGQALIVLKAFEGIHRFRPPIPIRRPAEIALIG